MERESNEPRHDKSEQPTTPSEAAKSTMRVSHSDDSIKVSSLRRMAVPAAAVLLYLFLLDAAVETMLSGSPGRWVVGLVVLVYLGGTVIFWRRLNWNVRLTSALALALLLAALSVWLPEGVSRGLTILGQPTSRVLTGLSLLTVLMAALILGRTRLPLPLRIAILVIAAYGVAGFLYGLLTATPFATLLQGGSLWRRFPFWLQGAFLGAFLIVPLGVSALLIRAREAFRFRQVKVWSFQAAALVMGLVIAAGAFSAPAGPVERYLSKAELVERLQNMFAALDAATREASQDFADPKTLAESIKDPARLFEWVRDETYWVPYRGALRGQEGVLLDRVGNSLDRSLLLLSLLRYAGEEARLAHTTLLEEQAVSLLTKIRLPDKQKLLALFTPRNRSGRTVEEFAQHYSLDPNDVNTALERQRKESQRLSKEASRRVRTHNALLASKVAFIPSDSSVVERNWQIEAVRDHWWVQWKRNSEWVDMDVILPDGTPGSRIADPARNLNPSAVTDLPEELLHTVSIQVIVEFLDAGAFREVPVFSYVLVPAALLGEDIVLSHASPAWPTDFDLSGRDVAKRVKEAVLAQHEWIPLIRTNSQAVFKSAFTDSGEVKVASRQLFTRGAEALGGRIGRILGGGGRTPQSSPGQPPATSDDRLTAEWIEYEIRSPGKPVRKVRREIFDLIGPAKRAAPSSAAVKFTEEDRFRRGLALLGQTEILAIPAQLSPAYLAHSTAKRAVAARDLTIALIQVDDPTRRREITDRVRALPPGSGALLGLAVARSAWSDIRGDIFLGTPNVLSFHRFLAPDGGTGLLKIESFDIVANEVALLPGTRGQSALIHFQQGIADTNAEALLPLEGRRLPNAADLLERGGKDWITIQGSNDPAWQSLDVPQDIRVRITRDVNEGHVVIVPRRPVVVEGQSRIAWWSVDPRTGQVLGISENGWGNSGAESTLTTGEVVAFVAITIGLVDGIFCAAKHAGDQTGDWERERAAWKCFLVSLCIMLSGIGVVAATAFAVGPAGLAATPAIVTGICGLIGRHM